MAQDPSALPLESPLWASLQGGYRVPYDPRSALRALADRKSTSDAWSELWQNLHHQGDIGEASYAAVPHIVRIYRDRAEPDWNAYAIVTTIEEARSNPRNPPLPETLRAAYEDAPNELGAIGLRELGVAKEEDLTSCIFQFIAIWKDQRALAQFASYTEDERAEIFRKYYGAT